MIKYFKIDGEVEEDHEPLGEHVDTGIMTLIRLRYSTHSSPLFPLLSSPHLSLPCPLIISIPLILSPNLLHSEVQGLVVFDQLHKKFLNVEELGQVGDLVLIMGRKIEFLLEKGAKLTPTLHKVVCSLFFSLPYLPPPPSPPLSLPPLPPRPLLPSLSSPPFLLPPLAAPSPSPSPYTYVRLSPKTKNGLASYSSWTSQVEKIHKKERQK